MENVRRLLGAILRPDPPYPEVKQLILFCHRMAVAYLRTKGARLIPVYDHLGLSLEDIAYDSIAELFRVDSRRSLVEFNAYFKKYQPIESRPDEELSNALRQLVFSSVNHRIFRLYKTADPVLSKLIRNIKRAVQNDPNFTLRHEGGKPVIGLAKKSDTDKLPWFPSEYLQAELWIAGSQNSSLREILRNLEKVLQRQTEYRKQLPVVDLAMIIRSFYQFTDETPKEYSLEFLLTDAELESFIAYALRKTRQQVADTYIKKGKLTPEELNYHLSSVQEILKYEFSMQDGESTSFYDVFKKHYVTITKSGYQQKHRGILEYLVKHSRGILKKELKKEFQFP